MKLQIPKPGETWLNPFHFNVHNKLYNKRKIIDLSLEEGLSFIYLHNDVISCGHYVYDLFIEHGWRKV